MLYSRSIEDTLDPGLFENPPAQYRGAPFSAAWGCRLDPDVSPFPRSASSEKWEWEAHIFTAG